MNWYRFELWENNVLLATFRCLAPSEWRAKQILKEEVVDDEAFRFAGVCPDSIEPEEDEWEDEPTIPRIRIAVEIGG